MKLFEPYKLGTLSLNNRMVMAPMTRSRAIGNIPNDLMATYYGQRAGAGLIVTEGTSPSPNGLGYPRIPGIFNDAQIEGWKKSTAAVHSAGGKMFLQLMHTGRVSHPLNMPEGAEILAPSAISLEGNMYTDTLGEQPYPKPTEMSTGQIESTIQEFVVAASNALTAGFDGVELHGANGYLIEQFIHPCTNHRKDDYGGIIENRCRFALAIAKGVSDVIGAMQTGIRISPLGAFNGMTSNYDTLQQTYTYLATELKKIGLAYIHIVDHSSMGAPEVPREIKTKVSRAFAGTMIASGGLDRDKAEDILERGHGDLVSFGRPFLANPDLVERFKNDLELNEPNSATFYTSDAKGYIDYTSASTPIEHKSV